MKIWRKRLILRLRIALNGHILNPLWLSRLLRRRIRNEATCSAVMEYLKDYIPYAETLREPSPGAVLKTVAPDTIFSIWLQGEHNAPPVVQACWRSVRANCRHEIVILDENSLSEFISLPDYILNRRKLGKIRPAHFADICRVALLSTYGGLWLDATDFIGCDFQPWLWREPFFVYMSGDRQRGSYSFVQNCFIRADRSSFLIRAWRDMIFEYWRREESAADYFIHQLLLKVLIENNTAAKEEFDKMTVRNQDPTHVLWFENAVKPFDKDRFDEICSSCLFQKTEYKSAVAKNPPRGSMAEAVIEMYQ